MSRFFNSFYIVPIFCLSLHAQWITGFYEAQNGVEPATSIPWSKYTHIIHFAAVPGVDGNGNGDGSILLNKLSQQEIASFINSRPPGKLALISITDNRNATSAFSQSTASGVIGAFVSDIAELVTTNRYDGVDIDWEDSVNSDQYNQLLSQLRAAMPDKVITVDVNNNPALVQVAAASQSVVDQFHVMCYDMDNPANGYSWYNDALFQNGNGSVSTCDWRVHPFVAAGVAPYRLGIGIPFFGRRWQGVMRAGVAGNFRASTVYYSQLSTDSTRWQSQYQFYDDSYRSNYLSIPGMIEFDSYTGPEEIQDIAAWIKSSGFGGAMTYSLHYEFLPGVSGDAKYPLSTALYQALFGTGGGMPRTPPPKRQAATFPMTRRARVEYAAFGLVACMLIAGVMFVAISQTWTRKRNTVLRRQLRSTYKITSNTLTKK